MGLKDSMAELKDFFNYKRKESLVRTKLVKKSLKNQRERTVYVNFRRVMFEKIDEELYKNGYSKIVLKPVKGKADLFDLLVQDEEFQRYYEGRLDVAGNLEVTVRTL